MANTGKGCKQIPDDTVAKEVLRAAANVEERLDEELERLEKLDREELEQLREARLGELRRESRARREWAAAGHGAYGEAAEGDLFGMAKRSAALVAHFYDPREPEDRELESSLRALAETHLETRFVRLDGLRCPFLVGRLGLTRLPVLLLVAEGLAVGRLVRPFPPGPAALESALARAGLLRPPAHDDLQPRRPLPLARRFAPPKKTLRGSLFQEESDSD